MSDKQLLDNIKKLRELTGRIKDCKIAIDECNGDLEKSIEFLRKRNSESFKENESNCF